MKMGADEDGIEALSPRIRLLIRLLIEDLREWRALDERIAVFDKEFVQMARNEEPVRRLVTIPGIGTINATARAAAVGNARAFRRGRDMAAWLGLTPRQMTTGGKPRLLGISKRGNRYLRKNLIHGARAVLPYLVQQKTPLGRWACGLLARAHKNVVVVAPNDPGFINAITYFSLSALTTAGFGDIVPMHPFARSLANLEAIIGQLYPATLLARIVTLELAHRRARGRRSDG
jgi:hypothetical protein